MGDATDALLTDLSEAGSATAASAVAETSVAALKGLWAIVAEADGFHHGHQILGVDHQGDGTALRLVQDPGYEIGSEGGEQAYFPGRSWQGETTVEITTTASWSAGQD